MKCAFDCNLFSLLACPLLVTGCCELVKQQIYGFLTPPPPSDHQRLYTNRSSSSEVAVSVTGTKRVI